MTEIEETSRVQQANELLQQQITQEQARDFYNSLESVKVEEMIGLWHGDEFTTGHPMEGLLTAGGWYGKKFISAEEAYPLIFQKENGWLYAVDPTLLPLTLPFDKIPFMQKITHFSMKMIRPLIATHSSSARLREVEYQGKVSGAMVYDTKGIIDVFRKIDNNTLMGAMDIKGIKTEKTYYFILYRVHD